MPDWRTYVRERLAALSTSEAEREEIVGELAGHLEEYYFALQGDGMSEKEALRETCLRVGNWEELRQGIVTARQEGSMSNRVRQIWLPGVVTLFSSYVLLAFMQWLGMQPFFFRPAPGRIVFFYTPWLLILPFIGAAGALLSRRARALGWRVYISAALPALLLAGLFAIIFPLAFIIDPKVSLELKSTTLATMTLSWVILPGIALCSGAALQGLWRMRAQTR
jgi:hypothetical protein